MKLLQKGELKGIDSTSATIEKWDAFLRKAVWNLGYKQEIIDGMYPYDKGIPMRDGTRLPLLATGRAYFEMSLGDKFAAVFSVFKNKTVTNYTPVMQLTIAFVSLCFKNQRFAEAALDEEGLALLATLKESYTTGRYDNLTRYIQIIQPTRCRDLFRKFFDNSDVYILSQVASNDGGDINDRKLSDEDVETLFRGGPVGSVNTNAPFIICNKKLADIYDVPFPKEEFDQMMTNSFYGTTVNDKYKYYSEVYLQDYLVISLNPIDKFMCSTKQAFSSCMSIAKQDDTRGTNSSYAYGLPATFTTDAMYMTFMTSGKHKNMYWDEQEWLKDGENRDKEKAYKYPKMTCRSWTYKVTGTTDTAAIHKEMKHYYATTSEEDLHPKLREHKQEILDALDAVDPNKEKILVGRQYAARGEDFTWQNMIEILLGKAGVATGLAEIESLDLLRKYRYEIRDSIYCLAEMIQNTPTNSLFAASMWQRKGNLTDHKFVCYDRYGYIRGIYYDNLHFRYEPGYSGSGNGDEHRRTTIYAAEEGGIHPVVVGHTRNGAHGVQSWTINHQADMFKVMSGEQKYSFMNINCKICDECGEIIPGNDYLEVDGLRICMSCAEKKGYKRCPICNEWYSPENAEMHETINIREFTNPNNYQELEPQYICKKLLMKCSIDYEGSGTRDTHYICAHCGKQHSYYYYHSTVENCAVVDIAGVRKVRVNLCPDCLKKAVVCDKCKRVLFLDTVADAMLLLPNRRVVCPDCIDSIRMKQEKRSALRYVLENMTASDFDEESKATAMEEGIAKQINNASSYAKANIIKDVNKQIRSWLQAHPDQEFPRLKSSNTPVPDISEVDEVLETEEVLPF